MIRRFGTAYGIDGSQKWRNWQTRTVQVRVVAIPCGFDSHLLHESEEQKFLTFLFICEI